METFVVRVWHPAADQLAGPAGLRGEVEHPRSGRRQRFTTLQDLADALRAGVVTEIDLTDRVDAAGQIGGRADRAGA